MEEYEQNRLAEEALKQKAYEEEIKRFKNARPRQIIAGEIVIAPPRLPPLQKLPPLEAQPRPQHGREHRAGGAAAAAAAAAATEGTEDPWAEREYGSLSNNPAAKRQGRAKPAGLISARDVGNTFAAVRADIHAQAAPSTFGFRGSTTAAAAAGVLSSDPPPPPQARPSRVVASTPPDEDDASAASAIEVISVKPQARGGQQQPQRRAVPPPGGGAPQRRGPPPRHMVERGCSPFVLSSDQLTPLNVPDQTAFWPSVPPPKGHRPRQQPQVLKVIPATFARAHPAYDRHHDEQPASKQDKVEEAKAVASVEEEEPVAAAVEEEATPEPLEGEGEEYPTPAA